MHTILKKPNRTQYSQILSVLIMHIWCWFSLLFPCGEYNPLTYSCVLLQYFLQSAYKYIQRQAHAIVLSLSLGGEWEWEGLHPRADQALVATNGDVLPQV